MAYPYVCEACLAGRHKDCEVHRDIPDPKPVDWIGGGICICLHRDQPTEFEQHIIDGQRSKVSRETAES